MAEHNQQFDNIDDWANNNAWLTHHPEYGKLQFHAICYDRNGRLCRIGNDFLDAHENNAFPVRWIWPDQVAALCHKVGYDPEST